MLCALLGNWMFLLMGLYTDVSHDFALWTSALSISVMRLASWKFDLQMGR